MDYFKYSFNEQEWTLYLIDDLDEVIADESTAAEVKFFDKELYIRRSHINLTNILHEIWHVYFGYCYLKDTVEMSLHDIEEVSASLFSDKAESMIETAKILLAKFNELKDKHD
jgi:hypothetical protein